MQGKSAHPGLLLRTFLEPPSGGVVPDDRPVRVPADPVGGERPPAFDVLHDGGRPVGVVPHAEESAAAAVVLDDIRRRRERHRSLVLAIHMFSFLFCGVRQDHYLGRKISEC